MNWPCPPHRCRSLCPVYHGSCLTGSQGILCTTVPIIFSDSGRPPTGRPAGLQLQFSGLEAEGSSPSTPPRLPGGPPTVQVDQKPLHGDHGSDASRCHGFPHWPWQSGPMPACLPILQLAMDPRACQLSQELSARHILRWHLTSPLLRRGSAAPVHGRALRGSTSLPSGCKTQGIRQRVLEPTKSQCTCCAGSPRKCVRV